MPVPTELSKSQIDKLGKRLRDADTLDSDTIAALREVRDRYEAAMTEVADHLQQLFGRRPAGRVKTVDTLTQKLRRQRIKLSSVQDVAGVRIVLSTTRQGQDQAVTRIAERFPGAKVVDRRASPSHGYRAVHIIVRAAGMPVEVQVRTQRQDGWAQMCERLADHWGRQIRYGDPPDDPRGDSGHEGARAEVIDTLRRFADAIALLEELVALIERTYGLPPEPAIQRIQEAERGTVVGAERASLRSIRLLLHQLVELERESDRIQAEFSSMIAEMTDVL